MKASVKKAYEVEVRRKESIYRPLDGSYGIIYRRPRKKEKPNIVWEYCREVFALYPERTRSGFLFYAVNHTDNVIAFIGKVEDKLRLPKRQRIKFIKINSNTLYVSPCVFWSKRHRMSLLTILLRAGESYEGNFDEALWSEMYLRNTKAAVRKFLRGYTEYDGVYFTGWNDMFASSWKANKENLTRLKKGTEVACRKRDQVRS